MKRLFQPVTLLGRTALALGLAFVLFGLLSAALLQYTLVQPHTRQAADDLAAFLVLVAQIWVELPPNVRPDYEKELLARHQLRIMETEAPHPTRSNSSFYLHYLEAALSRHIGSPVFIHRHADFANWLWADFPMGGRTMRLGFLADRLQNNMFVILPFLALLGLFIAFAMSILLVRRITRPLAAMADATHRIGEGDFSRLVPETGPLEIAHLARRINQMEGQIRQLIENRTTLLAGISHDLRTPLARMRLELELLRHDDNDELVDELHDDIEEMEKLIGQTLLLARGLSGEEESSIDINALLHGIAQQFTGPTQQIRFRPMPHCVITGRANALKRVITNLVENAVNYGGGKPVDITCERSGTTSIVRVTDQGPGIPPGEQKTIFEPFHRLEGSRNRATGGSGLGLAIVDQLCRANGWQVEVASPAAGGAVFSVHLPDTGDSDR